MRQHVWEALRCANTPLTAYQLITAMSAVTGRGVKPTSVYRALDALIEWKWVVKIESMNAFICCQHPEPHDHHMVFICQGCGQVDEMHDNDVIDQLRQASRHKGYRITHTMIEMKGECVGCHSHAKPTP